MNPEVNEKTTYTYIGPTPTVPKVVFSQKAVKWLAVMADVHDTEVGVFGIVDERGGNEFFIREIFYPKHQEANHTTCEISAEGETKMANWLMDKGREDDLSKVRFWAHSHHTMGVSPSGQDETQAIERMTRTSSYLIRGIFNKKGEMSVSFFDYRTSRKFDHIKWTIDDEEVGEIRKKVEELKKNHIPSTTTVITNGGSYPNVPGGYGGYDRRNDDYHNWGKQSGGRNGGGRTHFSGSKTDDKDNKNIDEMVADWENGGRTITPAGDHQFEFAENGD